MNRVPIRPGEPLLLGVDGGGTQVRVRLYDAAERVLGHGCAGSANIRLGLDSAFQAILDATGQALLQAGLNSAALGRVRAGMGLAGVICEADRAAVAAYPHPFAELVVSSDACTGCLGAHAGAPGGVLILGTGSCGLFYDGHRFHSVGGWGFPISDGGSGARLGLAALQQVLLAQEGMTPATPLVARLLTQFDHAPAKLSDWLGQARPRDYAALAPLVFECAARGDSLAARLIGEQAQEAWLLISRLRALGAESVALLGGMSQALAPWLPGEASGWLCAPQGDAIDGALLLLRRGIGRER